MQLESTKQENLYRGPSSSKAFNERSNHLINDLTALYQLLNENDAAITANMDIVMRENFFLQMQVEELGQKIRELETLVAEQGTGSGSDIFLQSFYNVLNLLDGDASKPAYLDLLHGVITPNPTDISSKFTYTTESGTVFLPGGLEVFVAESNDTLDLDSTTGERIYTQLDRTGTNAIVDKNKNTFWVREVSYPETQVVTEVFGQLHVKLPTAGMTNLYANALTIHPYPEGSMRIRDIHYKSLNGDQWSRLPNYPTTLNSDGEEEPVVFENARKLFFSFPRTEMKEIRIFYSQPYWFENEGNRSFAYGFQGVDLQYRIYTDKDSEFVSVLDLSGEHRRFATIATPKPLVADGSEEDMTDMVEHHLYYDAGLSTEFLFGDSILAPLQKLYIKTVLKQDGGRIPVLKGLRFDYTFTDLT